MFTGGVSLLCVFSLYLVKISYADLFTKKGFLVYKKGDARALTGTWTVIMMLSAPPCPETWLRHFEVEMSLQQQRNRVAPTDISQWRLHLREIRVELR